MGALVLLIIGALGVISIDTSHVLFTLEVAPREIGGGVVRQTGELVYIAFAVADRPRLRPAAIGEPQPAGADGPARAYERVLRLLRLLRQGDGVRRARSSSALISDVTGSLQIAMSSILVFLLTG